MMTGNNHRFFAAGICASIALVIEPMAGIVPAGALIAASIPGATAPDWLEIRIGNRTLIPHRTITHVLLAWVALVIFGIYLLYINPLLGALVTGFSVGGLSHWVGDAGTPMGVPVWHPARRVTFKWWHTGSTEVFPVLGVWAVVPLVYLLTQKPLSINAITEVFS